MDGVEGARSSFGDEQKSRNIFNRRLSDLLSLLFLVALYCFALLRPSYML